MTGQKLGAIVFFAVIGMVSRLNGATITIPDDAATINEAMGLARSAGDEIVINSNGPFVEALPLHKMPGNNTIRAGDGFQPMIVGDASIEWLAEGRVVSQIGVFIFVEKNGMVLSGLHFRLDLTDLFPTPNGGYQVLKLAGGGGSDGNLIVNDCIIEFFGEPAEAGAVDRNMTRLEGGITATFNRCEWRYTMPPMEWPSFNNTVGYFQPDGKTLAVNFNDCIFGAVADTSGKARSIGAGGGAGGTDEITVNRCVFGANSFDGHIQQAWISPGVPNTTVAVNDSVFHGGATRQIGGLGAGLDITINRCRFEPTTGNAFLPEPGTEMFKVVNSVVQFRSTLLPGCPNKTVAVGDGLAGSRPYQFVHTTFVDLDGVEGDPEATVLNPDEFAPVSTFTNCIFDVPAFTGGVVRSTIDEICSPSFDVPLAEASGNIVNADELSEFELLPEEGFTEADPLLAADNIHLTKNSPAIDMAEDVGLTDDVDGGSRPLGDGFDVGADEFNPEDCEVTEETEVSCDDGADNDCDGAVDGDDEDCLACLTTEEPRELTCGDELDNDCDGAIDCDDDDCALVSPCVEVCNDDLDNDQDGATDCDDTDCATNVSCVPPCEDAAQTHFRFEEGTGIDLEDNISGDSHGTHDAEYSNDVPFPTVNGEENEFSLNFTAGNSARIGGSPFILHSPTACGSVEATLEFYIKPADQGHVGVFWTQDGGGDVNRYNIHFQSDGLGADYREEDGELHSALDGRVPLALDSWSHIACVRTVTDGGGHQYAWYVNGELQNTAVDGNPAPPTSATWTISGRNGCCNAFEGLLDEVRMTPAALTPEQFLVGAAPVGVGPFVRGDCDGNGIVGGSPTEAIVLLNFAFRGGAAPGCLAACDAEANGSLGITDALRILRHSFLGIGEPDAPFPDCVTSDASTDEELGCETPFCP